MTGRNFLLIVLLCAIACFVGFELKSSPTVEAQPSVPVAPATWTLTSGLTQNNAVPTVTKPAGGSGIKHVVTCVSAYSDAVWSRDFPGNGAANAFILDLVDGSTVIQEWVPTEIGSVDVIPGHGAFYGYWSQCNLNIVGSANTPMSLKIVSPTTSGEVNLVGYEAQ
jgi:hypothetical protein